jgi:hypothetical protein
LKHKRRYKRGYPVAILLGLEADYGTLWQIYSHVAKYITKIKIEGKRSDDKSLYNFHQLILDKMKSIFETGVKTVIVAAPSKTEYSTKFIDHIRKHHRYLVDSKSSKKVNFGEIESSANNRIEVAELVKSKQFVNLIENTTSKEADQIINILEKKLYSKENMSEILYTLKEIENKIYNKPRSDELAKEYLILTDKYLSENRNKGRIHRLMQIANNQKIQTRIIKNETLAGNRVSQFGGIIYFEN